MARKIDYAKRWVKFAKEDLKVSRLALKEGIFNAACFHAQQAAEKIFKSLFIRKGKAVPRVHSLEKLRLDLSKEDDKWTDFVPTRYPDALPGSLPGGLPNEKDAVLAVEAAEEIIKAAKLKE